jgi:hypothetical protein
MTEIVANPIGASSGVQRVPVTSKSRRLRPRHLWLVPGFAIAIGANELGKQQGVSIPELIAFGITPHLSLLLQYLPGGRASRLGSLAIPVFNLLHQPLVALLAFIFAGGAAVNGLMPVYWVVATLVWVSHIVIGWGIGDVVRHPEGHR